MKKTMLAAVFLVVAGGASADPLEGLWQTARDDNGNYGLIQVERCGEKLCGLLIRAFDAAGNQIQSSNVGRYIIWDTSSAGGGEYRGRVYSPDRDQEYNSKLILSGNRLSVSGCRLGICREGGVWTRN